MVNNTIIQQRSLTSSWTLEHGHGIPPDVFVDLQITIPVSLAAEIYLVSLCKDAKGSLYLAFATMCDGAIDQVIAQLITVTTGTPQKMECISGVTANILIGVLPREAREYVAKPVKVSPALIHSYSPETLRGPVTHLFIQQDKRDIIFDADINVDTIIRTVGSVLNSSYDRQVLTIDAAETDAYNSTMRSIYRTVKTINHIGPDSDGSLCIEINTLDDSDNGVPNLTAQAKGSCLTLSTSDQFNDLLSPEDLIDKHIRRKAGGAYSYYPLDDAYISITDSGYYVFGDTRNTFNTLGSPNYAFPMITSVSISDVEFFDLKGMTSSEYIVGGSFTGGEMSASVSWAKLRTIEPMYDEVNYSI